MFKPGDVVRCIETSNTPRSPRPLITTDYRYIVLNVTKSGVEYFVIVGSCLTLKQIGSWWHHTRFVHD
jgi:hypothetical protein